MNGGVVRALRLAHCATQINEEREVGIPGNLTLNIDGWHQDFPLFIADARSHKYSDADPRTSQIRHSVWLTDNL